MKAGKVNKPTFKYFLNFLIILFISCLIIPSSFSQSQKDITNLYSSYLKSLIYAQEGDYALALKELERVKSKDPQSIHIHLRIASFLIRLERIGEAEKILKQARRIDPDSFDVSLALIFVYSYMKKNKELEKEYEGFLKNAHRVKPEDINISEYLAQFYFYKSKPDEATKIYEEILKNNPDYIEGLFWLGYLYDEAGRRNEAINIWKKGLAQDSSYAPILNSLGYIYAQEDMNLDEAEGMIKKALEKEPENGAYLDSLGWVYFKGKNYEESEKYLIKAIERIKDPDIYEHLGDLYIKLGDIDKGVTYYKEGVSEFPDNKNLQLKIKEYGKKDKILKE